MKTEIKQKFISFYLPLRVGDAGHTIFGPPNGNISPQIIANDLFPTHAQYIVRAVNSHEALLKIVKAIEARGLIGQKFKELCQKAISQAEGQ